jgi:ubiquinone/menaquinone biosynthesis C-methylase UbiE
MPLYGRLKRYLFSGLLRETEPQKAYDDWSLNYDSQPGNLMLALDEEVTSELLKGVPTSGASIVDVGCGTGRHWQKIHVTKPSRLLGFDVSSGMLKILKQKFPEAETRLLASNRLEGLADESCDLVLSTLTIAHIHEIKDALKEWCRVLKPGGIIIITDYHPIALEKGARRTFRHRGRLVAVRNYIHKIGELREIVSQLQLEEIRFIEKKIDDSVKDYYKEQGAIDVFTRFYETPIIYGIQLKKADAAPKS